MRMSQLVRRASTAGLVLALTALPLLSSQSAHGDEIGDLQSRATQISQQMSDLQNQIYADTNAVETARYKASQIDAQITTARSKLADAKRSEDASRKDLSRFALQAYVSGGSGGVDLASLMSTNGNQIGQRQGYVSAAVGDRQQLVDDYEATQQVTKEQAAALKSARAQAADVQAQAEAKQASAEQAANQLAAMKSQLDGKLATLVAEKQAARAACRRAACSCPGASPGRGAGSVHGGSSGAGRRIGRRVRCPRSAPRRPKLPARPATVVVVEASCRRPTHQRRRSPSPRHRASWVSPMCGAVRPRAGSTVPG